MRSLRKKQVLQDFNPFEFHCIHCEYKTDNILDFLTHLQNKHGFKILTAKDVREYLFK